MSPAPFYSIMTLMHIQQSI